MAQSIHSAMHTPCDIPPPSQEELWQQRLVHTVFTAYEGVEEQGLVYMVLEGFSASQLELLLPDGETATYEVESL